MGRITNTVKTLLIANILFFLGSQFIGDYAYKLFALWFPENPNFQIWQIITHMFMHAQGGISHILFNMFALYIFGSALENYLGQQRFLFIYFSAGLGAAGLQILFSYFNFNSAYEYYVNAGVSPSQIQNMLQSVYETGQYQVYDKITTDLLGTYIGRMVGASGAIFGILTAFAIVYPNMPLYIIFVPIPIKAKYLIGGYFAINVFSALTGVSLFGPSNTAYWAHIGGAIIGFIVMWYWKKNEFNANRWN